MSTPMLSRNGDVAALLETIGDLLEIKGEPSFRCNAYRNAARHIESMTESVDRLHAERRLRDIPGVGEALAQKIGEFLDTGRLGYVEKLQAEFPVGLIEMLHLPGLGPKRARLVFDKLGIASIDALESAAREGRLRSLAGFGAKTEQNVLRELERRSQRSERREVGVAIELAERLLGVLSTCSAVEAAAYAGSLRRMRDTIGDLDILVASRHGDEVERFVVGMSAVREVLRSGSSRTSVIVQGDMQVDFRVVEPDSWGAALQYFTGSKAHNVKLRELAQRRGWKLNEYGLFDEATGRKLAGETEEGVYEALGMEWIPPEIREDEGEIELAIERRLPRLVELGDLRGDLHVHSDWSDGTASIEAMARAAIAAGLQHMVLTDHSKSLGVARGLNEERLREQAREIARVNALLAPFRILHGTESEVKRDGDLDFDGATLRTLDYVTAGVHSGMTQASDQMTARIVRALENPALAALAHPCGRKSGSRDAYDVDLDRVIATAAANGVALEINAQPERLDLNGSAARRAREAGVKLVINSDSHGVDQFSNLRFGIGVARRAWATAADVMNTLRVDELLLAVKRR
jgi:DNA polymerase (family 10)